MIMTMGGAPVKPIRERVKVGRTWLKPKLSRESNETEPRLYAREYVQ